VAATIRRFFQRRSGGGLPCFLSGLTEQLALRRLKNHLLGNELLQQTILLRL